MAQVFQLNGANLTYVMQGHWEPLAIAEALSGQVVFNRYRRHRWQTNVMPVAEYQSLRAVQGRICNITTTDHTNPNSDFATYYGALVESVQGTHTGPVFQNVSVTFMVRV